MFDSFLGPAKEVLALMEERDVAADAATYYKLTETYVTRDDMGKAWRMLKRQRRHGVAVSSKVGMSWGEKRPL